MTVNEWILNPGTGNPVREGETLTAYRLGDGRTCFKPVAADRYKWSKDGDDITHYQVSPPRVAEPATMSADEVLIRAREAAIEVCLWPAAEVRGGDRDDYLIIKAILAYERDRAKPLAEVAPHTVEDPDDRVAYDLYVIAAKSRYPATWENRDRSEFYLGFRAAIKRGRELERGE